MHRSYRLFRNCFCEVLALGLIASGRVRSARKRVFDSGAVTAVFFHKPDPRLLASCLRWLIKHGYSFISPHDLVKMLYQGKKLRKGSVWLSFDDGCREILSNVLPVTREQRIPITLFIPSGIIGGEGVLPWLHEKPALNGSPGSGQRDTITVAELREIATYPEVTIGSHTVSHAITTRLTPEQIHFELLESKRALHSWLHIDVNSFAFPEGKFSGSEKELLVKCGYTIAATTENAVITADTDPQRVPRFSVADDIGFLEAICNMVGVWRPLIDPLIRMLRLRKIWQPPATLPARQERPGAEQSA